MSEKVPTNANLHEKDTDAEQIGEIAHEQHEAIKNAHENEEQHPKEKQSEQEIIARAKELAQESDESRDVPKASPAERRSGPISKEQLNSSFTSQMKGVESELKPAERLFSRFLHAKPVEKASDAIGSTVARPNAMLSGSITAFIAITGLYFIAKYYGFQLSGFETIAAFIIGWVVGIIYDYATVMIRGNKKQ